MSKWTTRIILLILMLGWIGGGVWWEFSSREQAGKKQVRRAAAGSREGPATGEKQRRAEEETLMPLIEIPVLPSPVEIEKMTQVPDEFKELLRQMELPGKMEEAAKGLEISVVEGRAPPRETPVQPTSPTPPTLQIAPVPAPTETLLLYDKKMYSSFLRYFFLWVNGAPIEPDTKARVKVMESPIFALRASYGTKKGMKVILLEKLEDYAERQEEEVPAAAEQPQESFATVNKAAVEEKVQHVTPPMAAPAANETGTFATQPAAPLPAPSLPSPPEPFAGAKITAVPVPPVVMANGVDTSTVFATVTDQNGTPFVGHTVGWTMLGGPTTFSLPGFGGGTPSLEGNLRGDLEGFFSLPTADTLNLSTATDTLPPPPPCSRHLRRRRTPARSGY